MARLKKEEIEGLEALRDDALRKGLEKADANMVRVATDIINQSEVDDSLSHIEFDIVPFEIPDTSLRHIILKAPQYVIDEVEEALRERKHLAEFGGEGG